MLYHEKKTSLFDEIVMMLVSVVY